MENQFGKRMDLQDIINAIGKPDYDLPLVDVYAALGYPKEKWLADEDHNKMCRIVSISNHLYDPAMDDAPKKVTFYIELPPTKVPYSRSDYEDILLKTP